MKDRLNVPLWPWLVIVAASLWLRSGFPVHVIGYASLDDLHFVREANSIGAGRWLGALNMATLSKGPFYPVFIAASFAAGIPLKLAEQGVYLVASALVARLAGARWRALALFAALALIPVFWNPSLSRVIREGLYVGLSLAAVALAIGLAVRPGLWRGFWLGLVLGAFWLTREEGVWLVPALLLVLGWGVWRQGRRLLPGLSLAGLLAAATVGAVIGLNWRTYGVAETVDVRAGPFVRTYGALSRIGTERLGRYVVFPAAARAGAYRVSEAAREIEPFLEDGGGAVWRRVGCNTLPGNDCTTFLTPWFQWALRTAVADAGYYRDGPATDAFYGRLATEIDAACDHGDLACLPKRASLAPPFRWSDVGDAVPAALTGLRVVSTAGGDAVEPLPGHSAEPVVSEFADIVGPVARAPRPVVELAGTVGLPEGAPTLSIAPGSRTGSFRADVALEPPNASDPSPPGRTLTRFTIATDCPADQCELVVAAAGRTLDRFRLDAIPHGPHATEAYTMDMVAPRPVVLDRDTALRNGAILLLARAIGAVYALLLPPLALAGLVLTALRREVGSPLFILALASAAAILSRVALLAYVDVTAIPSISLLYLSPAAPFVVILAGAGLLGRRF